MTTKPEAERTELTGDQESPAKRKLDLRVDIKDVGPCRKKLSVEIPTEEVRHKFQETLQELRREAQVPGFRPGRAPRGLVERRFRKEVAGQVKSALLMECMEQLDEDYKLNPIQQPQLDLDAIELAEDGPLKFEVELEVQPDFELPDYKSLVLKRPVKTIRDADIDAQLRAFLERYARLVPKTDGGAELGDYITADLTFHKDGTVLNEVREVSFRFQPELRFQDGHVPGLAEVLRGVKPGQTREAAAQIGSASPDPALRGQTIQVRFQVHDLKRLELPEVNAEFLASIGFDSREELREALRGVLERRAEFLQRQALRRQILDQLIAATPFDLPPELVRRQERSTLRRQVEELRQSGLSDGEIRAREAELRANAHEQTLRSLKEYFLLARIAEAEGIAIDDNDFEDEIAAIAARSDESPRRVRARIEKEGLTEGLLQQILERKTIDRILSLVRVEDVAMTDDQTAVETLDQTATGAEPDAAEDQDSAESATK
ncbi:MAG: trigger factor [Isosphaeraceae bacterium]|nr:MAG: trigger factor [Isosphaeraceae bacterium]